MRVEKYIQYSLDKQSQSSKTQMWHENIPILDSTSVIESIKMHVRKLRNHMESVHTQYERVFDIDARKLLYLKESKDYTTIIFGDHIDRNRIILYLFKPVLIFYDQLLNKLKASVGNYIAIEFLYLDNGRGSIIDVLSIDELKARDERLLYSIN